MRQLFSSLPTHTHTHTVVACLPRSTAAEAMWHIVPTAAPAAKLLASPPNANQSLDVVARTSCVLESNNSKGWFHTKEDTTGLVFRIRGGCHAAYGPDLLSLFERSLSKQYTALI